MLFSRTDLLKAILFAQDNEENEYIELMHILCHSDKEQYEKDFYIASVYLQNYINSHI